jgi:uncharacterized protein (TIGR00255 family)
MPMIYSMTAFARVQQSFDFGMLCWELRSVNHRYSEVSFRVPDSLRYLEPHLRVLLKEQFHRGKLECHLRFSEEISDHSAINLNTKLVQSLLNVGAQLAQEHAVGNDLSVRDLLAWPGVVQTSRLDSESIGQVTEQLFQEALSQLLNARLTEGGVLKEHIKSRLHQMNDEIAHARQHVASTAGQTREKLLSRLQTLQFELPETRFEQEIALILTRLDVSEELDRLNVHVEESLKVLDKKEPVGRRLDFLMQELNREANTLSSKADTAVLTQHAVHMKVLIEQMREQIQNIE